MAAAIPSIACLGVIGRNNNPLHVTIFPSYEPSTTSFAPIRTPLQFSLLLSSSLDIFELRAKSNTAAAVGLSGELGLLHAIDDRLAAYGFETNTGVKFVVIIDMRGRSIDSTMVSDRARSAVTVGLRDVELKPVFKAIQAAYISLLQNPFFQPDEHSPLTGQGGKRITSKKFSDTMKHIGETWTPGVTHL
ncbi:hypothetical protein CFIMG_001522RA [Ceratocystis fimbriata CBS 114723]|uniref:Trafficking protein particle complex subunit 2-like protein n=1 Tax=Ceratocystis fimbriata CBS 114723 TaxID=1035309 RepID=A0A2C5X7D2_9PEZI|nr:hypothetical protein CFIMG_001522RA [Ceratocystis fimbriata CBS 114723]